MYAFLIDETGRVISYQPTNYKLIKAEVERPAPPHHPKPGIDYVEYWDDVEKKIVLKEVARPLTDSEKTAQSINDINQLLADIMAGGEKE